MRQIVKTWMRVITLVFTISVVGFAQNPVYYKNLSEVPELPLGLLPDCDLHGGPFFDWSPKQRKWVPRSAAGEVYSKIFKHIGQGDFSPDSALAYVIEKNQGEPYTGLMGYPGSLCSPDGGKTWCVSYDRDSPVKFSGYFICRINEFWALYDRDGCGNPTPVPDTFPKNLVPKPGIEIPKQDSVRCCTTIVKCPDIVIPPCPPPPPLVPTPCDNCCPEDSVYYTAEPSLVLRVEREGEEIRNSVGAGFEWAAYRLHKSSEKKPYRERTTSIYGGVKLFLSQKGEPLRPTWDTCGCWGDEERGIDFFSLIYGGLQENIFKKKVFLYQEIGYHWYDSRNSRGKLFGDEGIYFQLGLRGRISLPEKMPLLRYLDFKIGPKVSTYGTPEPESKLKVRANGQLDIALVLGPRSEAIRLAEKLERDSSRRERAREQFVRDSTAKAERDSIQTARDSALVAPFLVDPDSLLRLLAIDSVDLPDFTTRDSTKLDRQIRELQTKVVLEIMNYLDLIVSFHGGNATKRQLVVSIQDLEKSSREYRELIKKKAKREAKAKRKAEKSAK